MRRLISSGSPFETEIGYSRAVVVDGWVFVSGTTGYDYAAMRLAEGVVAQCDQAMANIATALEQAGATISDIVQIRYILPDAQEFPACWPVLRKWLGDVRPAATMIEARLMEGSMRIEIEVTARLKSGAAGK